MRVAWRRDLTASDAIKLCARALWEASDADSATGGPDSLRGIYPVVASITRDGWLSIGDDSLAEIYKEITNEVGSR
jgi:proteasome beta subunit